MTTAILLSGGMDSTTLLWQLKAQNQHPIHAISIDYNQRHRIELTCATHLARDLAVHKTIALDLSTIGNSPLTDPALTIPIADAKQQLDTVVPFRNMLLVTLAAAYCETQHITDLYLAPVKDDYPAYRDCRRPFYDNLEKSLRLGATRDTPFALHTPFINQWKSAVIARGLSLGVPYAETHTCYEGQRPACGLCDACAERIAAFKANDARDPLAYAIDVGF
ncbi:MAG: 7-cyano-7-deazaguanine synthase [Candidatus Latescibacterota bacterium]|nr:7-cyano-7-deazaguanine synthase [Candidatus Latescibacterota bacterium]